MYVPDAHGGQKKVSDAQKLELWIVVNYLMGAENQIKSSVQATCVLNQWAISPAHGHTVFYGGRNNLAGGTGYCGMHLHMYI